MDLHHLVGGADVKDQALHVQILLWVVAFEPLESVASGRHPVCNTTKFISGCYRRLSSIVSAMRKY